MPFMHLVSTDLPAPLSPTRQVTLPGGRSRSTEVSACTGPKCLSRPRTSSKVPAAFWSLTRRGPRTGAVTHVLTYLSVRWDVVLLADAGPDGGADRGRGHEAVLDHGRRHVRRVHPLRGQEHGRLLVAAGALRRRRRAVDEGRRRGLAGAQDRGQRDRGLGLQVDRLVDRAALVALEDVDHALRGRVLAGRRDLLGGDAAVLEDLDHRVAEPVVGLDRRVDVGMRRGLLLEDRAAGGVDPTRGDLLTHQGEALAVGRARLLRGGVVAPDDLVVALGERDRVRVRVLAAAQHEDLWIRDVPRGHAVHEALADQLADLHVVEAVVISVVAGERRAV